MRTPPRVVARCWLHPLIRTPLFPLIRTPEEPLMRTPPSRLRTACAFRPLIRTPQLIRTPSSLIRAELLLFGE